MVKSIIVRNSHKCYGKTLELTRDQYFRYLIIVMSKAPKDTGHFIDITYNQYCECKSLLDQGISITEISIVTGISKHILTKIKNNFLKNVVEKYES